MVVQIPMWLYRRPFFPITLHEFSLALMGLMESVRSVCP